MKGLKYFKGYGNSEHRYPYHNLSRSRPYTVVILQTILQSDASSVIVCWVLRCVYRQYLWRWHDTSVHVRSATFFIIDLTSVVSLSQEIRNGHIQSAGYLASKGLYARLAQLLVHTFIIFQFLYCASKGKRLLFRYVLCFIINVYCMFRRTNWPVIYWTLLHAQSVWWMAGLLLLRQFIRHKHNKSYRNHDCVWGMLARCHIRNSLYPSYAAWKK
jgi:hypothetical protein